MENGGGAVERVLGRGWWEGGKRLRGKGLGVEGGLEVGGREKTGERWKTSVFWGGAGPFFVGLLQSVANWIRTRSETGGFLFHVEHFPFWARFPRCSTWNKGELHIAAADQ